MNPQINIVLSEKMDEKEGLVKKLIKHYGERGLFSVIFAPWLNINRFKCEIP